MKTYNRSRGKFTCQKSGAWVQLNATMSAKTGEVLVCHLTSSLPKYHNQHVRGFDAGYALYRKALAEIETNVAVAPTKEVENVGSKPKRKSRKASADSKKASSKSGKKVKAKRKPTSKTTKKTSRVSKRVKSAAVVNGAGE